MKISKIVLFLILLVLSKNVYSQLSQGKFKTLTTLNGLSSNMIFQMNFDKKGFLWISTYNGLNRYDGNSLKVFKLQNELEYLQTQSFFSNAVSTSDNLIYAGTFSAIVQIDPLTGTMKNILTDTVVKDEDVILKIYETPLFPNKILTAGSKGVRLFDPLTKKFEPFPTDSSSSELLNGSLILDIKWFDSSPEYLFFVGYGKILVYNSNTGTTKTFTTPEGNKQPFCTFVIQHPNFKNSYYIGANEGLYYCDTSFVMREFELAASNEEFRKFKLSEADVSKKYKNTIWIGTVYGGIYKLDLVTGEVENLGSDKNDPESLDKRIISRVIEDKSGVLWVGTIDGGVYFLNLNSLNIVSLKNRENDPLSPRENNISLAYETKEGKLLLSVAESGMDIIDHKLNKKTELKPTTDEDGLQYSIVALIRKSEYLNNELWVSGNKLNVGLFNPETLKFRYFPTERFLKSPAFIVEENDSLIWLIEFNENVYRYDYKNDSVLFSFRIDTLRPDLNSPRFYVTSSMKTKDGNIWLSTNRLGVMIINPNNYDITVLKHDSKNKSNTLPSDIVSYLFQDDESIIWIGTILGLIKYDISSGKFIKFNEKDVNPPFEIVSGIVQDKNRDVWLSTFNGLYKYDRKMNRFFEFGIQDGLSNSYILNLTLGEKTGYLYASGFSGVSIIDPTKMSPNLIPPSLSLTGFELLKPGDNSKINLAAANEFTAKGKITLDYENNSFTVNFSALNFINSEANNYAYLLSGFDDDWIYIGSNRSASFTNLPPGEYILKIAGSNNNGIWNYDGLSIKIIINPPWYRTALAYTAFSILLVVLLYSGFRFQSRNLLKKEREKAFIKESELRVLAAEAQARAIQEENLRKTQELEEARKLQLSMLPSTLPELRGYDIAVYMKTATEVGGDYYDFKIFEENKFLIAIGDATGHGLKAGIMVSLIKWAFTSLHLDDDINTFFNESTSVIKSMKLGNLFMGLSILKFNDMGFNFSSAGMPPLFYFNGSTGEVEPVVTKSMPLGAFNNLKYENHNLILNDNDVVLLVSDGLTELFNENKELFGESRVKELLKESANLSAEQIIEVFKNVANQWSKNAILADDLTMVVLKKLQIN